MRLKKLTLVAVGLGLAGPVLAAAPTAMDVLKKAQAAAQAVQSVTYEAEVRSEVTGDTQIPPQAGKVTLARNPGAPPKMRLDISRLPAHEKNALSEQIACDGTSAYLVNHRKKQFRRTQRPEDAANRARSSGLMMHEFITSSPFKRELNAESVTLAGTEQVGGVECYVIQVRYARSRREARLFIGATDYLPRQVESLFPTASGQLKYKLTLKALELNPAVEDDVFRLEAPAGYALVGGRPGLLAPGAQAPDFSLKTPDGKTVALRDLRGKVVVLDFWATWCVPCRKGMPAIQRLHERHKDSPIAIFGVDYNDRGDPAGYMKKNGFTYGLLLHGEKIAKAYGIRAIPVYYVIGHDGEVVYACAGGGKEEEVARAVEQALKQIE